MAGVLIVGAALMLLISATSSSSLFSFEYSEETKYLLFGSVLAMGLVAVAFCVVVGVGYKIFRNNQLREVVANYRKNIKMKRMNRTDHTDMNASSASIKVADVGTLFIINNNSF